MSVLPSFKTAFSSLADPSSSLTDDSPAPIHRPWALATSMPLPSVRPTVPALQLGDLVSGDAPTFGEAPDYGFARMKTSAKRLQPLPLEAIGLVDDQMLCIQSDKRQRSPLLHAGPYKRPRARSVSQGASYVKVSPPSRNHTLPHSTSRASRCPLSISDHKPEYSRTFSSTEPNRAPTARIISNLSIPSLSTKTANLLSFPSLSHPSTSKGNVASYNTSLPPGDIIEDSTCRAPVDVLCSPAQRSLISGAATANRATANSLSLSRGPTPSDLSHLLGATRNLNNNNDVPIIDGTDRMHTHSSDHSMQKDRFDLDRTTTESDALSLQTLALPKPVSVQPPLVVSTTSVPSLKEKSQSKYQHTYASDKDQGGQSYASFGHTTVTMAPSQGTTTTMDHDRREPWRQPPPSVSMDDHLQYRNENAPINPVRYLTNPTSIPFPTRSIPLQPNHTSALPVSMPVNCTKWTTVTPCVPISGAINNFPAPVSALQRDVSRDSRQVHKSRKDKTLIRTSTGSTIAHPHAKDARGGTAEETYVQCPHCTRQLRNQITLQNHIRVVHHHSGNYSCPKCGHTFMWKSTLGNHVRLVHEKQRPYACDKCAKAFRWKSHLREHCWVVHDGEKPFTCQTCGKTFGRKNNMQKHMRKHTDASS